MSARPASLARPAPAAPAPTPRPATVAPRPTPWAVITPTRTLLRKRAPHYLARGRKTTADLRLLRLQGTIWVVKDFAPRPWWIRWTLGLWLTWRELAAFKRLQGVPGVLQTARRVDRFAFAYHYVEGTPLNQASHRQLSPEFFRRYEQLVEAMHQRGIAHLGLRSGSNVLVSAEQQPVVLDFQTHLHLPRWLPPLMRLIAGIDFNAINALWNRYMLAMLRSEHQATLAPRATSSPSEATMQKAASRTHRPPQAQYRTPT